MILKKNILCDMHLYLTSGMCGPTKECPGMPGEICECPGMPGEICECPGVRKECPERNHVSYKRKNHCKNKSMTAKSGF